MGAGGHHPGARLSAGRGCGCGLSLCPFGCASPGDAGIFVGHKSGRLARLMSGCPSRNGHRRRSLKEPTADIVCSDGPLTNETVSLSEIRSGRNDGAIRRGSAAAECYLSPGQTSLAASPWPTPDVSEWRCNTAGTSAAHNADAARRTRSHDQGNRVGSSQSVVRHTRSAKAIAAPSVCRECPSRERAA